MRRNLYAVILLALLAATVTGSELWVQHTAQELDRGVRLAYACAIQGDYDGSRAAYHAVADQNRQYRRALNFLVRRSLLDKIGETLATLSSYAGPDNMADLAVETHRACEQIDQMRLSYLAFL